MRPKSVTVTGDNDPYLIPVNYRASETSIQADVAGTIDYTVSYTLEDVYSYASAAAAASGATWTAVADMTAATADAAKLIDGSINCLKVVVNSGDGSVKINVSQPDS